MTARCWVTGGMRTDRMFAGAGSRRHRCHGAGDLGARWPSAVLWSRSRGLRRRCILSLPLRGEALAGHPDDGDQGEHRCRCQGRQQGRPPAVPGHGVRGRRHGFDSAPRYAGWAVLGESGASEATVTAVRRPPRFPDTRGNPRGGHEAAVRRPGSSSARRANSSRKLRCDVTLLLRIALEIVRALGRVAGGWPSREHPTWRRSRPS